MNTHFQRGIGGGEADEEKEESELKVAESDQTVPTGGGAKSVGLSQGPTDVTWSQPVQLPPFQSLLMVANSNANNNNNQNPGSLLWNHFSNEFPRDQSWTANANTTNNWNNSANISDIHSVPITYSEFINTNSEVDSQPAFSTPQTSASGSVPAPVVSDGFAGLLDSLRGEEAAGQPASAGTESTVSAPSPGTKPANKAGALC